MKHLRTVKTPKPKPVAYELLAEDSPSGQILYPLLRELVAAHHDDLREARIALAFCTSWKPDVDGRLTLGKCRKASDLDKELSVYDFVILLSKAFVLDALVTTSQRRALIDHELCHAAAKYDQTGEPVYDERGRRVYRLRKHNLEEFSEIAERYGTWKKDIEVFARSLERAHLKSADSWVGYTTLRNELAAAGLTVPLNTIVAWSDAERRDAYTWAAVRNESPLLEPALPALLTRFQPQSDVSAV